MKPAIIKAALLAAKIAGITVCVVAGVVVLGVGIIILLVSNDEANGNNPFQ